MTVGIAASEANSALDTLLGSSPLVGIHTGDPGSAGTANASVGDSSKKTATMASASGGSKSQSANTGPWTNGGTSETLTHISLWISTIFKLSAALTTAQAWASTNTFTLTTLTVSFTPIAA